MRLFESVNVFDLRRYLELRSEAGDDEKKMPKVWFEKAYSLYGKKRWIDGRGKLTPDGQSLIDDLQTLGTIPESLVAPLATFAAHKGNTDHLSPAHIKKLNDYGLVNSDNEVTLQGQKLLHLMAK